MILHTVNSSPFSSFSLNDCLNQLSGNDKLLLIEDAVLAVSGSVDCLDKLIKLHEEKRLYVLQVDLNARGLQAQYGEIIDYSEFVNLCIVCNSQLAW